ncbi:MAG TPA: hypothetical protein PLD20_10525 [Blastocatellia bacterium]|nr:hypothetical protein [Blastocatellia bacterium]HMV86475.1 hypothetical protein [Blastocatellia bacterium]HMX27330.1 hypothetical protein [Blastocatellia bacterium]HMY72765.1 hypothetical protein [Blastocatellia bacterium]HMZ18354.1 hypothetical protein [Blastocatellia bacterium]
MSYSDFTNLKDAVQKFNLTVTERPDLFEPAPHQTPSAHLQQHLKDAVPLALAIHTEKARSELIVSAVLLEMRRRFPERVSFFSGTDFTIAPELGLAGFCDFLISRSPLQEYPTAPVIAILEAKNDNIKSGLGQCVATMIGARIFNEREGQPIEIIGGAVTTGTLWRFLRLQDNQLGLDQREYSIAEIEKILGILFQFVGN